jgi:hypothetical protein
LRHAEQDEPVRPLIPLGTVGQLEGLAWQVVGFQHRMGQEPGDDEQFGWEEYLLYNARRGFSFLVDATDGWSLVKPVTGAPVLASNGQSASYQGTTFKQQYAYKAETTYVAGEFYWQVQRGQKTDNRDFASGKQLLSMEQSRNEITWSAGSEDRQRHGGQGLQARRPKGPAQAQRRRALHGGAQHRHHPHHRDSDRDPDRAVAAQPLQPLRPARGELLLHHGTKFRRILGWQLQRRGTQMNVFTGGHHGN